MLARHKTHTLDYVDAALNTIERVTDNVIIKKNKLGNYIHAFCFCCGTYIQLGGIVSQMRLPTAKAHICKEKQSRGGVAAVKAPTSSESKPARSILKIILNHKKFADSKMKIEEEYGDLLDDPDADEIEDFVIPWMTDLYVDAVKAEPIRNSLKETISNLTIEKGKLEDYIEQLKTSSSAKEKDLTERMYTLSRQVSEESSQRHAAEARLKLLQPAAPAPVPDKIVLVDESKPVQWSLLYQG